MIKSPTLDQILLLPYSCGTLAIFCNYSETQFPHLGTHGNYLIGLLEDRNKVTQKAFTTRSQHISRASSTANIRNQSLGSKNKVCDVQKKPGFSAHCHLTSQIVEDSRVWVLSSDMPPSRSTCPMSSSHPLPQKEPSVLTTLVFSGLLTASNTSSCPRQE